MTVARGSGGVAWAEVWAEVARQLGMHRAAGRGHVLTEDTVRISTVLALETAGIRPERIAVEVHDPALAGGKLDLVVDDGSGRTVMELKYPRGSRAGISPDTMTLGELLRDFLRVGLVPAADRWVVAVLEPELRRYLSRRQGLGWSEREGGRLTLDRDLLEALPKTTVEAIGKLAWLLPVSATCEVAVPVDVDLALFAFRVDAPPADSLPKALRAAGQSPSPEAGPRVSRPTGTKPAGGARAAILAAIDRITTRSGYPEVTIDEVLDELRRSGSPYADSTIRTMMASHLCAQAQGPGIDKYDDLDRVARGRYRLRRKTEGQES